MNEYVANKAVYDQALNMPVVYSKAIASRGDCRDMTLYGNGQPRLLCMDGVEAKCNGNGAGPDYCEDDTAKGDIKLGGVPDLALGVCADGKRPICNLQEKEPKCLD